MRMFGKKSRPERRSLNTPGWISVGGAFGLLRCMVLDYSASGAQLRVLGAPKIPRQFTLSFSRSVREGKSCELIWRDGERLGVKFTGADANAEPPA
jgi:hypothetical protein